VFSCIYFQDVNYIFWEACAFCHTTNPTRRKKYS